MAASSKDYHGTVDVIALDAHGDIASGVSTSGLAWKYPGRVGDSPIIGAGNYADNRYGACGCTGYGEMAIRCTERLQTGALVEVQLLSPRFSECLPAPAKVVWAHHTGAAGISFLHHNPELERIIRLWTH